MEALAVSLVNAVPLLAGVPLWTVTLLLMVMVAAVILVFALTFEGVGRWCYARSPATSRPGSARTG